MKVLILGCGPAGLFAAHAAIQLDHDVQIISKKRRSEMFGAQNLLQPVPGLTDDAPCFYVRYSLDGTWEGYRAKVYGEDLVYGENEAPSGVYPAWDIRAAYYRAWSLYHGDIEPTGGQGLGYSELYSILMQRMPDVVVSTIPAPALCYLRGQHSFASAQIWTVGDAPERGIFAPMECDPNTITYDGTKDRGWHRAANIAGYNTIEWPGGVKPPVENVSLVTKPIATNCDCMLKPNGHAETIGNIRFLRAGRYGAWDRLTHAHHAYWEVSNWLQKQERNVSKVRRFFGGGTS